MRGRGIDIRANEPPNPGAQSLPGAPSTRRSGDNAARVVLEPVDNGSGNRLRIAGRPRPGQILRVDHVEQDQPVRAPCERRPLLRETHRHALGRVDEARHTVPGALSRRIRRTREDREHVDRLEPREQRRARERCIIRMGRHQEQGFLTQRSREPCHDRLNHTATEIGSNAADGSARVTLVT